MLLLRPGAGGQGGGGAAAGGWMVAPGRGMELAENKFPQRKPNFHKRLIIVRNDFHQQGPPPLAECRSGKFGWHHGSQVKYCNASQKTPRFHAPTRARVRRYNRMHATFTSSRFLSHKNCYVRTREHPTPHVLF